MSKTKEFLINFQERFGNSELDELRQRLEAEEMEWYFSNQERPYYEKDITEEEELSLIHI